MTHTRQVPHLFGERFQEEFADALGNKPQMS